MEKLFFTLCGMVLGCVLTKKVLGDMIEAAIKQVMIDMDE